MKKGALVLIISLLAFTVFSLFGCEEPTPTGTTNNVETPNPTETEPSDYLELDRNMLAASLNEDIQEMQRLLDEGADINVQDIKGWTPLCNAVNDDNIEVALFLLNRGANVNARDMYNSTPLHEAVRGGDIEMVTMLIEHGADVNMVDDAGNTPLAVALQEGKNEAAEFLKQHGSSE